jgi:hypothetical protein
MRPSAHTGNGLGAPTKGRMGHTGHMGGPESERVNREGNPCGEVVVVQEGEVGLGWPLGKVVAASWWRVVGVGKGYG